MRAALAWLCVALAGAILAGSVAMRADPDMPDWSAARKTLDGALTLDAGLAALDQVPAEGMGVVVAQRSHSPEEAQAVASFVARGGRALVLGDATVARALGVAILPERIVGADAHPVVDPRPGARVLVATSNDSFVDADGDGRQTVADVPGPFAVAVASPDGRVVVAGSDAWLPDVAADLFPAGTRVALESASRWAAPGAALVDAAAVPWRGAALAAAIGGAGAALSWRRLPR